MRSLLPNIPPLISKLNSELSLANKLIVGFLFLNSLLLTLLLFFSLHWFDKIYYEIPDEVRIPDFSTDISSLESSVGNIESDIDSISDSTDYIERKLRYGY